MSVTVRRNFGPLRDIPLAGKELMHEVGLLARERIVRRTVAGEDSRGYAFRRYSDSYAQQKHKALGNSSVDLQVSGNMLRAIANLEETDTKVVIGFKD
jgi:hypothetical protein